MKKQQKCYIYTRVSTSIQVDGYSLDAQKDKLRKYAEFQDMEIVGEYSDEGHSGKNIKGRIAAVAEMERENIRVQTMAWREQKARRQMEWRFASYGYKLENGEFPCL